MLEEKFTKRSMQLLILLGIIWVPVVLVSPIPNKLLAVSVFLLCIGLSVLGAIAYANRVDNSNK